MRCSKNVLKGNAGRIFYKCPVNEVQPIDIVPYSPLVVYIDDKPVETTDPDLSYVLHRRIQVSVRELNRSENNKPIELIGNVQLTSTIDAIGEALKQKDYNKLYKIIQLYQPYGMDSMYSESDEDTITIGLVFIEKRARELYTLYLCFLALVAHENVTKDEFRNSWPFLDDSAKLSLALHDLQNKYGIRSNGPPMRLLGYPLEKMCYKIISMIVSYYLENSMLLQFDINEDTGKIEDKIICDSLFTALVYQMIKFIEIGDAALKNGYYRKCLDCGVEFVADRKNLYYCEKHRNYAAKKRAYRKNLKGGSNHAPQDNP